MAGGTIIIPMDIKTAATIRSMIKKGRKIKMSKCPKMFAHFAQRFRDTALARHGGHSDVYAPACLRQAVPSTGCPGNL